MSEAADLKDSRPAPQATTLWPNAAQADATAHRNLLLTRALDAVQAGDLEQADQILRNTDGAALTLGDVFRLYKTELEAQSLQLHESQMRTEQALDWFAGLFRNLPVAALLVDRIGMVIDASAVALDELALRHALGKVPVPLRRLAATADGEVRLATLLPTIPADRPVALDNMALRALDGRPCWADVRLALVPERAQGSAGPVYLCVLNDRTAWVEAQRAREAAALAEHQRDLAQSSSLAKTQLLARVSHELRTPLNAVIGFSQLLLLGKTTQTDQDHRYIGLIQEAGKHLLSLVDEVLQINMAEGGHLALEPQGVSLLEQARTVLALQHPMAETAGLRCEVVSIVAGQPEALALADPRRVREVLTNLVSNAIKYNRAGGDVRLVHGQDERTVWLAVIDTGIGLSEQQLSHLFEPFNRFGADRSSVRGHGLGLSIARTVTQAMGGQLTVQSTPGTGSNFLLTLPRWDAAAPMPG